MITWRRPRKWDTESRGFRSCCARWHKSKPARPSRRTWRRKASGGEQLCRQKPVFGRRTAGEPTRARANRGRCRGPLGGSGGARELSSGPGARRGRGGFLGCCLSLSTVSSLRLEKRPITWLAAVALLANALDEIDRVRGEDLKETGSSGRPRPLVARVGKSRVWGEALAGGRLWCSYGPAASCGKMNQPGCMSERETGRGRFSGHS